MSKPVVAIVGRPNVGKSSLLNKLVQSREAIVEGTPGVTRDRIYRDCLWNNRTFTLVDTGGILIFDPDNMRKQIRLQVEMAIDEADVILFLVDVREGLHALDHDVADMLRNTGKKIIVVPNKADNLDQDLDSSEFFSLGWGEPLPVSSIHGRGTGDLLDRIVDELPPPREDETEEDAIHISIVGRPNVGKSSILNALLGQERSIVTDIPGTTRDAVDSTFSWGGRKFVIVDTAGMRRKGKIDSQIEYYSAGRSRKAVKRSQVGLLVIDVSEPAVMQDKRVGGILEEWGKGIILVINKWDLVDPDFTGGGPSPRMKMYEEELRRQLDFLRYAPMVFTSALNKIGINKILPQVVNVYQQCIKKIDTPVVNSLFQDAFHFKSPPSYKGQNLKMFYAFQSGTGPPTFTLKVNSPRLVHFSYKRYLENQVRRALDFTGTPIRLVFKK